MSKRILFGLLAFVAIYITYYQMYYVESYFPPLDKYKPLYSEPFQASPPMYIVSDAAYVPISQKHDSYEYQGHVPRQSYHHNQDHHEDPDFSLPKARVPKTPVLPEEHIQHIQQRQRIRNPEQPDSFPHEPLRKQMQNTITDWIEGEPIRSQRNENIGQQRQRLHQMDTGVNLKRFIR
jgi:hypothetical protein